MAAAKTKASAQIHAVVGSDDGEVKRVARELSAQLAPANAGDFGVDIIDGTVQYADDAAARIHSTIEALLTFPFFGGEKLVWLKSANFLADDQLGRAAAVIEALEKLTETLQSGVPEATRFLLSAVGVDKRRSFYKSLGKLAKVQVFDRVDSTKPGWEEHAFELVESFARARNLAFSQDAAELFVLLTGGDRRVIESEVEKLDLYLGPAQRSVKLDDVRLLVPLSREGVVFEIGNAIAERNLDRALELLDQLLFQGETPIGLMYASIIPTVRNLLLAKDFLVTHGKRAPDRPNGFTSLVERLPAAASAHFPRKKDGTVNLWPLGIAATQCARYELPELRAALEACLETNIQLVTSALEPEVALSQLLIKIIAPAR